MLAYEADTSWNRAILCIVLQNSNPIVFVIFIYLFFDLLYQRDYQRWYVLESKWKCFGVQGRYSLNQWNNFNIFQSTNTIVIVLFIYLLFYFLYQRGYQRQYFWTLSLKVLAYEAATNWNMGTSCRILRPLIKLYFFCLQIFCST